MSNRQNTIRQYALSVNFLANRQNNSRQCFILIQYTVINTITFDFLCLHILLFFILFLICQPCVLFCLFKCNPVRTDKTLHISWQISFCNTPSSSYLHSTTSFLAIVYDFLQHFKYPFSLHSGCSTSLSSSWASAEAAFSRSTSATKSN